MSPNDSKAVTRSGFIEAKRQRRWDKRLKRRTGYYRLRARVWRKAFERFARPSDVFLVGHPKSGNTWVAYMLAILLFEHEDRPVTLGNLKEFMPFVHGRDHKIFWYPRLPNPRVFRQENPCYPDLYHRVVYLVRDPRAALVSLWHMFLVTGDAPETTLTSFVEQYMNHDGCFAWWNRDLERWDHHVSQWCDRAESDGGVLVVRYEDLVRDRATSVTRMAAFLGAGTTDADASLAIERGDFAAMQRVEDRYGAEAYHGRNTGKERFIRKGSVEGWREEMSPELAHRVVAEFGPVMRRLGYLA